MSHRTIGLFLRSLPNPYQEQLRDDCRATARRLRCSVNVFSADNDSDKQLEQIRSDIHHREGRPSAIFVSPVRETGLLAIAREAARMGIGWVVLNRTWDYIAELRASYPNVPIFAVDSDQEEIGRIQGQQFKTLLPDGGELVYLHGPLVTSSAHRRYEGMQRELRFASIHVAAFASDWSTRGGTLAVENWLQGMGRRKLPPCVIGAQNDDMAMGAREAIVRAAEEQRRPEPLSIPITGCDGSPEAGQQLVNDHLLAATVILPCPSGTALTTLMAALDRNVQPPATITLEVASYPSVDAIGRGMFKAKPSRAPGDGAAADRRPSRAPEDGAPADRSSGVRQRPPSLLPSKR